MTGLASSRCGCLASSLLRVEGRRAGVWLPTDCQFEWRRHRPPRKQLVKRIHFIAVARFEQNRFDQIWRSVSFGSKEVYRKLSFQFGHCTKVARPSSGRTATIISSVHSWHEHRCASSSGSSSAPWATKTTILRIT
eukprot:3795490-Pleurochrysis_carterae.AAC.1